MKAFVVALLLFTGTPAMPAAVDELPRPCRDSWDFEVRDYDIIYDEIELHGLQWCARLVGVIGPPTQVYKLEPTDDRLAQTYPPGGVFFLWAPETRQYASVGFVWQGRGYTTVTEVRMCIFDVSAPYWMYKGYNWHHRLDIRYGDYNQPDSAMVVSYLINPHAVGR